MTDIVDRLRAMKGMGDIQLRALMDGVGPQAADEIERLRSETSRLQKEADKFEDGVDWIQRALQAEARIEAMEKQEPVAWTTKQDTSVRKAWARFSNELHRSPDAPYPGMADAFERHFSQSFTDREWRSESATWAAAWKAAKRHGAQAQSAPSVPEGWKLVPIEVIYLYSIMCAAFVPMTPQQEEIAIQLDLAKRAMLAVAPESKP